MKFDDIRDEESRLLLQTYTRNPLLFTKGHGVFLSDEKGNEYLDLVSGIGVSALGYGNSTVEATICAQSKRLLHTSNLFYHEHTAALASRLTEISGMDRVFLCNSGTEAWEAALKLTRAHSDRLRAEGGALGTQFIAVEHSFHGRTMGSVATTHKLSYRTPFVPLMPNVVFVRMNDIQDLRDRFSDQVCGVCVEVIQGEGGIHQLSREFLLEVRRLCDSTGALLIADEIQCGFGRTGKWFAYQQLGVQPDVVTIAKPLANGLPIGAMLCNEQAASAMKPGMHGSTFGGGPLACAVATAVVDEIRHRDLLKHVAEIGLYFKEGLSRLASAHSSLVREVRGVGLMLGMELYSENIAKLVVEEMLKGRIILNRTSETVLRFLPPYILERHHVDRAIAALDRILDSFRPHAIHGS